MHPAQAPAPLPARHALVLSGGGVAGIAWMLGIVAARPDLAGADLLVGTSAGACVAAQVAAGELEAAVAAQRAPETAEVEAAFDADDYQATLRELAEGGTDRADGVRRIAALDPPPGTISMDERRAVIAARFRARDWPARRLVVTAVDRATGARVVFDRDGRASLLDAVTASCALPGVWPAAVIGGRELVDGGMWSGTNADLAAGAAHVTVLLPSALTAERRRRLDDERAALGAATVELVAADAASLEAIGPNPLDPARRAAALEAGLRQGV